MSCVVRGAPPPRRTRRNIRETGTIVRLRSGTPHGARSRQGCRDETLTMDPDDKTAALAARIAGRIPVDRDRTLDRVLADDLPGNAFTTLLLHSLRRRAQRRTFGD